MTGDLARHLPDGAIEFLGRSDFQVKIRGFRVELGEIEAVLSQHPAIDKGVVIAREDDPGDKQIVAYVVFASEEEPSVSDLQAFVREKLPDYMAPSAFVTLKDLPLMANGKVDRKALPAPEKTRPELEVSYAAPSNQIEETIAEICQDLLKVEQVGRNDNFFDLGAHSLLLLKMQSRLQDRLGRHIPVVSFFRYPSVSSLAVHLAQGDGELHAAAPDGKRADELDRGKERLARLSTMRKRTMDPKREAK
jgi:acyl carrier protein